MYQISNCGNVRSLDRITSNQNGSKINRAGKPKAKTIDNLGYYHVRLSKDSKTNTFRIHRLVAEAFIENPNGYKEINHIDQNKLNNDVSNLEWCTHKENVNHGDEIERGAIKQRKSFRQLDMDGNLIKVWNGFKKMQRETGFERKSVYECCIGKRESYKGYRWEYAEVV